MMTTSHSYHRVRFVAPDGLPTVPNDGKTFGWVSMSFDSRAEAEDHARKIIEHWRDKGWVVVAEMMES